MFNCKSKKSGFWFSCSFFLSCCLEGDSEQLFILAGHGAVDSSPAQRGTIVHAGGWTAGGGSPDPEAPRTIVRYPDPDKPDPDPIHRGVTCLKPNNSPIKPRSSPISSRSEQLFGLRSHTLSK